MKPRKTLLAVVPLAILLLPIGVYAADRATSTDEVARNVMIDDVPVGGMNRIAPTRRLPSRHTRTGYAQIRACLP